MNTILHSVFRTIIPPAPPPPPPPPPPPTPLTSLSEKNTTSRPVLWGIITPKITRSLGNNTEITVLHLITQRVSIGFTAKRQKVDTIRRKRFQGLSNLCSSRNFGSQRIVSTSKPVSVLPNIVILWYFHLKVFPVKIVKSYY